MKNGMDFLVTTDKNYIRYLRVLMTSVYVNNDYQNTDLNFYVLYNDLSNGDFVETKNHAKKYGQNVKFIFVNNEIFKDFPIGKSWPISCMYILLAHELLPKNIDKILYLDIDIAVNGNLRNFYNLNFLLDNKEYYLIASKDFYDAKKEPKDEFDRCLLKDFVTFDKNKAAKGSYFNSGVLLFNLKKFRKDKIDLQFYKNELKDFKDVFYDQGVLNLCFGEKTIFLKSCRYNYRLGYSVLEATNKANMQKNLKRKYQYVDVNPVIYHYCGYLGNFKPWRFQLDRKILADPDYTFLELLPESSEYSNVWWKYAEQCENDYIELKRSAEINKKIYEYMKKFLFDWNTQFLNAMQLEPLKIRSYLERNKVRCGDDLNEIFKPKAFICSASDSLLVKNLPNTITEKSSFRLSVKYIDNRENNVVQILEVDKTADIYRRAYNIERSKWGNWHKMIFDDEIEIIEKKLETQSCLINKLTERIFKLEELIKN